MSIRDPIFMDGPLYRRPHRTVRRDPTLLGPREVDFAHAFASARWGFGGSTPKAAYRGYRQALAARNRQRPKAKLRLLPFKFFLHEIHGRSGSVASCGGQHLDGFPEGQR